MPINRSVINGFLLALGLFFVSLFLINWLWAHEGHFLFFLKSAWELKTLVGYGSLAAIPIVGLFAYFLQKREDAMAQGVQYFLIVLVLVLAYLKFFTS